MLYKRKAITEKFRLRRINRITQDPFCNDLICTVMLDGGVINKCRCGCIDLCYRLSDYNSTYEQYIKHKLRYIGM